MSKQHRLTKTQIDTVIQQYESGASTTKLAEIMGISAPAIWGLLKRRGVVIRDASERVRKHSVNHAAFDDLTSEALYWVGFIFADGNVGYRQSGSPSLTIRLSCVDKNHLVKFSKFLKSSHKIFDVPPSPSSYKGTVTGCQFSVRSKTICDRLVELGWAKNLKSTLTPALKGSRDFWRGVIDGDGSITFSKKSPRVSLVGSMEICNGFAEFIKKETGYICKIEPHKNIFATRINNGTFAAKAIRLLYSNSVCSLDRKQSLADKWGAWKPLTSSQQGELRRKAWKRKKEANAAFNIALAPNMSQLRADRDARKGSLKPLEAQRQRKRGDARTPRL